MKPSIREIAERLKLSEEDVVRALEVGGTVSLDGVASSGEDDGEHSLYALLPDNDDRYERLEIQDALRSAMKDLSETERAVLRFRYVDELSQSETARRLGVSQMFVSRMERKLLARLKENLKDSV